MDYNNMDEKEEYINKLREIIYRLNNIINNMTNIDFDTKQIIDYGNVYNQPDIIYKKLDDIKSDYHFFEGLYEKLIVYLYIVRILILQIHQLVQ